MRVLEAAEMEQVSGGLPKWIKTVIKYTGLGAVVALGAFIGTALGSRSNPSAAVNQQFVSDGDARVTDANSPAYKIR